MNLEEYCSYDGLGLAALVRDRRVTPRELAELATQALERVNPQLNAVVHRVEPSQLQVANGNGPFAGVPFLLKDVGHGWAGVPSTMGSRIGIGLSFEKDGPIASRFRQAGFQVIGVSASPEFGSNAVTESFLYGPTRNPWDPGKSPGGSSGGAAAAVAAGIVPVAHATDGGGSIRLPAAWCGLVGLKPSRGVNPYGSPSTSDGNAWVVAGHVVSRTLRDTVAALDATSGPVPGDFIPLPKRVETYLSGLTRTPKKLRVALCTRFKDAPLTDPECVRTATEAARHLQSLGHIVEEVVPDISYEEMSRVCFELFIPGMAEGILAVSKATGRPADRNHLEPHVLATIEYARTQTLEVFRSALNRMVWMSREMARFHERFDVLLTPAVSQVPCDIGVYEASRYEGTGVDFWSIEAPLYAFSPLASITGQPALVLPFPVSDCPLPTGIQISAAIGGEDTLFQLGAQIEATHPWSHLRPPIHAVS